ncbi:MAG TPA: peptidylprolyl isomerase [Treponemataceae bacterium]|nr:peptidylprolyl isomerase [Treponemataceae bacterium]
MKDEKKNVIQFKKEKKKKPGKNNKVFMTVGGIIIFVMAAIAFIFAPSLGGSMQGEELPPLGIYKGNKIEYKQNSHFANTVSNIGRQYQDQGNQIDSSTYFTIFNQAFNSTVVYYEAKERLKEAKYLIPDSEINRAMLPYFYDSNGNYSAKIFRDTPDSKKIELRKLLEDELMYQRYITDLFGSNVYDPEQSEYGLKTTQAETDFIVGMNSDQRSFKMASFNTADYPEEEIIKYGKNNADMFKKYNLSIVTLQSKEDADSIYTQLTKDSLDFATAVSSYSSKAFSDDNGILSDNYAYQLDTLVTSKTAANDIEALKNLEEGSVSSVIKTSQGYSVFMGKGTPFEADITNSVVINDIYTYMTSYERGEIEDYFVNKAKEFAAAALTSRFERTAEQYNAKVAHIPAFPINYANNQLIASVPNNELPELRDAESNENFLQKAFSLENDEVSDPIILGSYVVLLQLTEKTRDESGAEQLSHMYSYHTSQLDQNSLSKYVLSHDKLENNLFDVYVNHFMN